MSANKTVPVSSTAASLRTQADCRCNRWRTQPMKPDLRKRTEDLLNVAPEATPVLATSEMQKVIHELQVHQIELEMQNEDLRHSQSQLALSRDAYAELYDFAPVGYMTLDRNGAIQEANHSAAALLGVGRGALTGRKLSDFVQHAAQDAWFLMRRHMLLSDEQQSLELALHQEDNSPIIARLDIRPVAGAAPEAWRAMVAMTDISTQKCAENALQEAYDNQERLVETRTAELQKSQLRFKALADLLPQPIWETDLEGYFTYGNRAGYEELGYEPQDIKAGVHITAVIAPEDRKRIRKSFMTLLQGGVVSDHEYMCARKDGSVFPSTIFSALIVTDGRPSGMRGLTLNISERKDAEKLRDQQTARLRHMSGKLATAEDDERRRIAEGLHDDVAQLMSACSLMLGAAAKTDDAEKRNAIVNDIDGYLCEAGEKVRSLSFDLASATLYRLGLREALQELCETMNARHESQFSLTEGPPLDKIDEAIATTLLRATRELLLNVVRHAGVREASVSLAQDGDALLLAVADSGQGFPVQEDGQPDVGQRLGLFSIEARLLGLGGKIQIQSISGAGARVTLRVPLCGIKGHSNAPEGSV
jgi:PAS domain S-box-containing protein